MTDLAIILAGVRHVAPVINASTRRVGGIRFFRLGRFRLSFCIARR
ncbi:hypothetical protein [Alsobacter sp. SYSU BS001988]